MPNFQSILLAAFALTIPQLDLRAAEDGAGDLAVALTFEAGQRNGHAVGWGGGPASTIFFDTDDTRSGVGAVRLERVDGSEGEFTALTKVIPVDFAGETIELRGFLRTEDVAGHAGLWVRVDGAGSTLAFDNMNARPVTATTPWAGYSIKLAVDESAEKVYFGALLSGSGTVWVDDLSLLVDGEPIADASARQRSPTILDTDTEFSNGSRVTLVGNGLSETQAVNIAVLGRIWGFVKYHHPAVAEGDFHWDFELFRILPTVLAAADRSAATEAIADWIEGIGIPDSCDPCAAVPENTHLLPDYGWIHERGELGLRLAKQLEAIYEYRFHGDRQFFVGLQPGVGNPIFTNELRFENQRPPDDGYRLLALFRLWNMIEYWFPYRDQIDGSWDAVLNEFVPRFANANDWDAYRLAMFALITRIGDGHANMWSEFDVVPPRGECYLPIHFRWVEDQVVVAGYAAGHQADTTRMAIGDVVDEIDGRGIEAIIDAHKPYYSGSNEASRLATMVGLLPRGACGAASIRLAGHEEPTAMERSEIRLPRGGPREREGAAFQLLDAKVAYLKLSAIDINDIDRYVTQAAGASGWIIDIRGYPAAFSVFALGSRLVDDPTPFARFTRPDPSNPGAFVWTDALELQPQQPAYDGKIVILVDETSISQSEYTAMAFRAAPGAMIIGSQTAGADGNVSQIPLPGGLQTGISGIGVFYPDRTATQRVGIVPDLTVETTIAGIASGRDEVLEAAVRHILDPPP